MIARVTSAIFWLYIGLLCIAIFPVAALIWLITLPFDRRGWLLHKLTCVWAGMFTWPNPHWNVTIENIEKAAPRNEARIIVSNHLSLVDIPVVFRTFLHFKWVSKSENFKIPFVGWNMYMNRYIKLDRGSNKSNAKMMRSCEAALNSGSSVFIFPEGTRSSNGKVSGFKRGAFELARRTGKPIQPIVIAGSAEALPKKGLILKGIHHIRVRLLDPIAPESFAEESVEALTDRVRGLIRSEHESMRA